MEMAGIFMGLILSRMTSLRLKEFLLSGSSQPLKTPKMSHKNMEFPKFEKISTMVITCDIIELEHSDNNF